MGGELNTPLIKKLRLRGAYSEVQGISDSDSKFSLTGMDLLSGLAPPGESKRWRLFPLIKK